MRAQVFKYLSQNCSTNPKDVDRLIISAFVEINNVIIEHNRFIKSYLITKKNRREYNILKGLISTIEEEVGGFDFEGLIQLFEFVISPADRIVNGAIYTPFYIREYIVSKTVEIKEDVIAHVRIADISCGCAGFLFNIARRVKAITNRTYLQIFSENIFGLDIQDYSVIRARLLLSLLALFEGEDEPEFQFNLFVGNALTFNWDNVICNYNGFDIILGNPPYVCSRHLNEETKQLLYQWSVCKSGHPDLYIPFFQIGVENLSPDGILGYITMNSFFKSLNGRALRSYFQSKELEFKIIDFGSEQVFKQRNTYTCLCFIRNRTNGNLQYARHKSEDLTLVPVTYSIVNYANLDAKTGWNLQDNDIITLIESVGTPLGNLFKTRHGIATLKNDVFIFKPIDEDDDYYYLESDCIFPIEKCICKDIVNSNKLSRETKLNKIKEKIIFPYDSNPKPKLLSESFFRKKFPKAYSYLASKKDILNKRDKGKGKYENWFAFGRTQSLERMKNKLFFPKISDRAPSCIIHCSEDLYFYNGQAIISHSKKELIIIKKLIESSVFWYYIKTTSKPYSSNYYSLNGNYITNFGVCELTKDEKAYIIKEQDKKLLDRFFEKKYGLTI